MRVLARWSCVLIIVVAGTIAGLDASLVIPVPIQDRARGAERVVVGTVTEVTAAYHRNAFGDQLIVSHARLRVDEPLKGSAASVTVAIEGGTVNGITLRVSDLPTIATGERAVFFLTKRPDGEFTPHLRGQGILKLDSTDHVRGSALTLDEIRRLIAAAKQ
jgi:hypothetical protein